MAIFEEKKEVAMNQLQDDTSILKAIKDKYEYHLKQANKYKAWLEASPLKDSSVDLDTSFVMQAPGSYSVIKNHLNEHANNLVNEVLLLKAKRNITNEILNCFKNNEPLRSSEITQMLKDKLVSIERKNIASRLNQLSKKNAVKLFVLIDSKSNDKFFWCKYDWFENPKQQILKEEYYNKIISKIKDK